MGQGIKRFANIDSEQKGGGLIVFVVANILDNISSGLGNVAFGEVCFLLATNTTVKDSCHSFGYNFSVDLITVIQHSDRAPVCN